MTTIEPGRDISLIEWIERETAKIERRRRSRAGSRTWCDFTPAGNPLLARRPRPRTDDMRQMIEDIANGHP